MAKKTRKRVQLTLTLYPEEVVQLKQLAELHDCWWGDEPSISRLVSAIAQGDLLLIEKVKLEG